MIIRAAPDAAVAAPVRDCGENEALDRIMPFSSLILLGVVIAIEDRYGVRITSDLLGRACSSGTTLRTLATMIEELKTGN